MVYFKCIFLVSSQGDREDLTNRIQQLHLEAVCFLNIPSHGAGTNLWGTPPVRERDQVSPTPLGSNLVIPMHIRPGQSYTFYSSFIVSCTSDQVSPKY